jgi:hypothetical protein
MWRSDPAVLTEMDERGKLEDATVTHSHIFSLIRFTIVLYVPQGGMDLDQVCRPKIRRIRETLRFLG